MTIKVDAHLTFLVLFLLAVSGVSGGLQAETFIVNSTLDDGDAETPRVMYSYADSWNLSGFLRLFARF